MLYTPERLAFLIVNGYTNRTSQCAITPYKIAINLRANTIISTTSRDTHFSEVMVDDQIDALMRPNKKLQALKALRSVYDTMA